MYSTTEDLTESKRMKQYTSWGYMVEVELKDGRVYKEVLLCPNPMQNDEHLLEFHNGACISVETNNLKRITSHHFGHETILK